MILTWYIIDDKYGQNGGKPCKPKSCKIASEEEHGYCCIKVASGLSNCTGGVLRNQRDCVRKCCAKMSPNYGQFLFYTRAIAKGRQLDDNHSSSKFHYFVLHPKAPPKADMVRKLSRSSGRWTWHMSKAWPNLATLARIPPWTQHDDHDAILSVPMFPNPNYTAVEMRTYILHTWPHTASKHASHLFQDHWRHTGQSETCQKRKPEQCPPASQPLQDSCQCKLNWYWAPIDMSLQWLELEQRFAEHCSCFQLEMPAILSRSGPKPLGSSPGPSLQVVHSGLVQAL